MTTTEQATEPQAILEVEMRLYIPVPCEAFEGYTDEQDPGLEAIQNLRVDELRDVLLEDTDRLHDAIMQELEAGGDFIDIGGVEEIVHQEPAGKVELYKPDGLYTLPVPNLISGNVIFTDEGIVPVEVSNVNNLTDDQLEGAYYATKRVWGLRGMHRYQKEQIAEFLSELQWAMLARPSRHVFKASLVSDGDVSGETCSYCGNPQEGHLVRDEKDGE